MDSQGLPGSPVTDIELIDCQFENVTQPSTVKFTERLTLKKVSVNGKRSSLA